MLLPTTVEQMALIYEEVDPDTTCGCLVVCCGAVGGGDSCAGWVVVVVGAAAGADVVGGAFVDGVVEGAGGGAVAGVPEVGAACPGVVWAT